MKTLLLACGTMALACVFASADTLNGQLMDSACVQQQQQQPTEQHASMCAPTASTTSFALNISGKTYKLDADGNKKAADAWKKYNSSAERAKNPNGADYQVTATVQG